MIRKIDRALTNVRQMAAVAVSLLALAVRLPAHDIITTKLTYSRDISRILAQRCVSCHGEKSSIPLTRYEEVRPWAVAIKEQVLGRTMPPWGAVKGFGNLSPDLGLSQEEILIIAAWVVGGAPEGDPNMLPKRMPPLVQSPAPKLVDVATVKKSLTLAKPLRLAAIKPLGSAKVDSARIVARFPDGRIEPLVWLWQYDARLNRTFRFEDVIELPARTRIEADSAVEFVLEAAPQSALTGRVKQTVFTAPSR